MLLANVTDAQLVEEIIKRAIAEHNCAATEIGADTVDEKTVEYGMVERWVRENWR